MKHFDISPKIHPGTAVFPGDKSFQRKVALSFEKGDHLTLSSMESTLHIGAHVDAPNHYGKGGQDISEADLKVYFGRAQVIEIRKETASRIQVADLGNAKIQASRVLFKTGSFPNPDQWRDDFNALSRELVEHLASQGVRLVGIDTPSVDLSQDKLLEAHTAIFKHDLRILEGIDLSQVPAGIYTLIALPLKIANADASPVRAILVEKDLGLL